jgi:hypothetical protein
MNEVFFRCTCNDKNKVFLSDPFLNSTNSLLSFLSFFFFVGLGANFGLQACKAGVLPREPHLQTILLYLLWRWSLISYLPGLAQISILLSAYQTTKITGVIQHLALYEFFK